MVLTGLGFPESLLRAIVMTRLELDTCLAVTCKVQSATDVCVHLLACNFQILWAQLDLDKWGWMMCFAPTSCEKKRDVLSVEFSCEMFSDDAQLRCFCVRRMRITIYTGLFWWQA